MRPVIGVLALASLALPAAGAPTVTVIPSTAGFVESVSQGVFKVTITAASGAVFVNGSEAPVLSEVIMTGVASGSNYVDLTIQGPVSHVWSVRREPPSGQTPVKVYLRGITSIGTVGEVNVNQIETVDAVGGIQGPITSSGGLTSASTTGINLLRTTLGSVTGNITVDHGSNITTAIGSIVAQLGTLGTLSSPVTISARGPVNFITADSIYANINTFNSDVTQIIAEGDSGFDGDFIGSLAARDLISQTYSIRTKRDLGANITLTQPFMNAIQVGRTLLSGATLALPERGLDPSAQVTINYSNPSPAGEWLGNVTVGGVALLPRPDYSNEPRDLGPLAYDDGGSVGLAGFQLHRQGSYPAHGTTLNAGSLCVTCWEEPPPCVVNFKTARIRHYGPIDINSAVGTFPSETGDNVYTVMYSQTGQAGTFVPVSSAFKVATGDLGQISGFGREWLLQRRDGNDFAAGEYRVTLNAAITPSGVTRLRSIINPAATTASYVPQYEYRFKVIANCNADIESLFDVNQDSWINANDIGAWLVNPTDLTADNAVTGADLNRIVIGVATYGN